MRFLLTGASGMFGQAFEAVLLKNSKEVKTIPHKLLWKLNENELTEIISRANIIVHAAANTDVEWCEFNPEGCKKSNFYLTKKLTSICFKTQKKVVYISSTGVYGKHKSDPYLEMDETFPTTHHHMCKLKSENEVMGINQNNLIIRTGWLFGGHKENPKNFVARRIEEALIQEKKNKVLFSNPFQMGVPSYTTDIADRLLKLINANAKGIYNCVNEGKASRFDYVKEIIRLCDIDVEVQKIKSNKFNRKADVSDNEMALNGMMDDVGFDQMPHWRNSLADYIQNTFS